jgi:hypothetical protein
LGYLSFCRLCFATKALSLPTIRLALALVFTGGAAGKFTRGWFGECVGTISTVLITEGVAGLLCLKKRKVQL